MKAEYCVDYLSYKWNTDDLIQTYRETRKYSIICKLNHDKHEDYKHKRLQNALWREMARNCTSNLSQPNKLVDPSSVSWQKESDITWLYGPIYTNETQTYSVPASDHLQGIKPVLKKHSTMIVQPTALPTCSDDTMLELFDYYSSSFTTTRNNSFSSISSSSTATSTSHSTKVGVSFNPEIIEIEYQPEYPVSPLLQSEDEEESNKEEEDDVWSSLLLYVQRNHSAVNIFILLFKSFVSITTTWLLYQRLSKWTTKKKNFCK